MRRRSFSAFNALRSLSLLVLLVSFFVNPVLMEDSEAKEEEEEEEEDNDDEGGVEFVGFSDALFEDELFCVADGA